jgi:hypothetical protein
MFGKRALEQALSIALASNSDLKQQLQDRDNRIEKLLDRLMALTNVGALREVNRPLPEGSEPPAEEPQSEPKKQRVNRFPGNEMLALPTRPPTAPTPFPLPPEKVATK